MAAEVGTESWLVIGLSGVTCSGKTTLANNLLNFFKDPSNSDILGSHTKINKVKLLSQDDYFLPVDSPKHLLVETLKHINWEVLSALDIEKMCRDIMQILGNGFTLYSTTQALEALEHHSENYFSSYYAQQQNQRKTFHSLNILILEGFLLFNHPITLDICNMKFHLHLPYERCQERRSKRTYDPPDILGYFEMIVWPFYDKHFKEIAGRTDIIYLNAEVPKDKLFNFILNSIKNSL